MSRVEVETLIDNWVEIYESMDKRTKEAKGIRKTIIDLWHVLNCLPTR